MQFKTDLITYNGVYRSIMTEKLNIPSPDGRRTILANHMPIMIPLQIGVIETDEDGVLKHYAINGGVLYFRDNVAEIVADAVMDVEEIDVEMALEEKAAQEEKLAKAKRDNERIRARYRIEVAENLLKAAEKYITK
ncbi:MAG: F0F1 ATP synthase subunit epsilon [Erysipelotrichaceae bacterium]|nr:F0F1 ATP synthase subunit epsilon [Erysipelotrichaceae bacterium]